jgi:hypothetical protein
MAASQIANKPPSAGLPAGALTLPRPAFSYYEIYSRVEGIEASRQRIFRNGDSLVKSVQTSLANSVMGSGAASDETDFEQKVNSDVEMEIGVIKLLFDNVGGEETEKAIKLIANFAKRVAHEAVFDKVATLNNQLEGSIKMNLTTLDSYLTNEQAKGKVLYEEVMEDRKRRIASGGGARALAEKRRLEAQEEFKEEGITLQPKLQMRNKYSLALENLRKDALTVDLTDPLCDMDQAERESKREKAMQGQIKMIDRSIRAKVDGF